MLKQKLSLLFLLSLTIGLVSSCGDSANNRISIRELPAGENPSADKLLEIQDKIRRINPNIDLAIRSLEARPEMCRSTVENATCLFEVKTDASNTVYTWAARKDLNTNLVFKMRIPDYGTGTYRDHKMVSCISDECKMGDTLSNLSVMDSSFTKLQWADDSSVQIFQVSGPRADLQAVEIISITGDNVFNLTYVGDWIPAVFNY